MRTLLIQPTIRDFYRTQFREYPLGLLYLASALECDGFEVGILDARRCANPKKVLLPEKLHYLSANYASQNDLFLHFRHFGMSYERIHDEVRSFSPDAVCINAMFTPYFQEVIGTARAVKLAKPGCRVIAGGYHATVDPHSLMSTGDIDQIVRGEGERILGRVLKGEIDSAIVEDGDGVPFRIDDLDDLPFPARRLVDGKRYRFRKRPYTMILTSRGCPHRCSFCSVHSVAGHRYRKRSIDRVIDEVDECIDRHEIRVVDFQDDNLLFEGDRIKVLFEQLISRHDRLGVEFLASNGLNVAHLDEELLRLMKRCGFTKLDLAIGTGDVASRDFLRRPESIGRYEEVLEAAIRTGLPVTTYIILGIPTQPLSEMEDTVEYLMTKETLIAPSIFYNVPGMPIFDEMRKFEYKDDHAARRSTAFNNFGRDFDRDDIFNLFNKILIHNKTFRSFVSS